jgi:transcriptional regulator with XRE-family HTH domain
MLPSILGSLAQANHRRFCPIGWAKRVNPEIAFGDVLRALRRERGLSQEGLALEADLERNFISLLELGRNSASIRTLFKLCGVLAIAPSEFLRRVEVRLLTDSQSRRGQGETT